MRSTNLFLLLGSIVFLLPFTAVSSLWGQTAATESDELWIQAIREQLENENSDYQSELNQHGSHYEPHLVRLENLVLLATAANDFESRRRSLERIRVHQELLFGASSPQAWDTGLAIRTTAGFENLDDNQRKQLAIAAQNYLRIDQLISVGNRDDAIRLVLAAIELRAGVCGETHPDVLRSLLDAISLIESQGMGPMPEVLRQRVRQLLEDDHPDYLFVRMGFSEYFYREGELAETEQILRQTQRLLEELHFKNSEMYATVATELGTLAYMSGDYVTAKERLLESLATQKALAMEADSNRATCYQTLGLTLLELEEYDASKRFYELSLQLDEALLGEHHPEFWVSNLRFAWLLYKAGEPQEAYRIASEAYRKLQDLGRPKPAVEAFALTVHGKTAQAVRKLDEAESEFRLALRIASEGIPEKSRERYQGILLNNLAKCLQEEKKYDEAILLYERAIQRTRHELERNAVTQSERQQLASSISLKYQLDNYVTCLLDAGSDRNDVMTTKAYEQVFGWKGSVLVRQRQVRQIANSDSARPVFEELQRVTTTLSKISHSVPADPSLVVQWKLDVRRVEEEKESLQREFSKLAADYIDEDPMSASYGELISKMPNDVVLLDYLVIRKPIPRLVVFLVRAHEPVKMRDLGPLEPIESTIEEWRADIQVRAMSSAAASRLKSYIWSPLEKYLTKNATILVSTDEVLCRLPFAALPGNSRDRYLIEEFKLAMLPVPQLLPYLLDSRGNAGRPQGLMTLGDVDYESGEVTENKLPLSENRATIYRALGTQRFGPLQETKREIDRIQELFQKAFHSSNDSVHRLTQAAANEAVFRKVAPQCSHLHLATHGFFTEVSTTQVESSSRSDDELPGVSRTWRGVPTGLQSGLALAGANHPWRARDLDDGILTADEIATLPLEDVELVVLSACESGLGKAAGGEGSLGLQRAFQVSGARSTITSLWNVSDLGTRLLMDRFYENLWDRKLDKLDAFREAQLSMLGKSRRDPTAEQLRAAIVDLPDAVVRTADSNTPSRDFNHPFYWAAFQLSGDWR